MLHFREEMLEQHRRDLDRRLRLTFLLRGADGARPVKRGRWSGALTLLHRAVEARAGTRIAGDDSDPHPVR
ncbi:MAG: hypothetical protein ACXVRJ_03615 [Gaiellaceae bacterium]